MAYLQQKFAIPRELEDLRIFRTSTCNPDVVLGIDVNPMFQFRPFISGSGSAPRRDDISGLVEFDDRRSRMPACAGFIWLQGGRPMDDPNMILRISCDSRYRPDQPLVRKRFRPKGVHSKRGHHFWRLRASTIFG